MRPVPGRQRAASAPLPAAVLALAALGACALALPLAGLGARVPWGGLPSLLGSQAARTALGLSLLTCAAATTMCLVLGVPLALVLSRRWPGVRAARVLVVLPMTMPPVVAGMALLSTLGKRGVLGPVLQAAGLQVSFTTAAVVIAQVFVSLPYLVVTLEAALRSRDTHAETIARTLGAGPWQVLTRITTPLVAPALARGTALALGRSLGEFGATIAFAGSRQGVTRTMPLAIYLGRESDTDLSLALAVVLIAASALVVGATALPWGAWVRRRRGGGRGGGPTPEQAPPPTETSPAVGQDVHLSFSSAQRDVSVSLEIPAGRTLALVGANGSGKSTVCAVLAGLLDATGGRVRIGERVVDAPGAFVPAGRRGVALLSQSPGVFTHMSVVDNVAFGPRCLGTDRAAARRRALDELRAVGAEHLAGRSGAELSGGQAARVALARALATSPAVLVLDEPMASLDVGARQEVRSLVAARARDMGLTVLLVTHDVVDVAALADSVVVLEGGRVAESGPAAQVLAAPRSDFAAHLTGTAVATGTATGDAQRPGVRLADGTVIWGRPGQGLPAAGQKAVALIPPDAVALHRRAPEGSPRNALDVVIEAVERTGALVTVGLVTDTGLHLAATVTASAVAQLDISPGQRLVAVVKAVQVRIVPGRAAVMV